MITKKHVVLFFSCFVFSTALAKKLVHEVQSWDTLRFNQHLGKSKKWHYFFKQEARFDMRPQDVFDESLTELYLCYDHSPRITTCLG